MGKVPSGPSSWHPNLASSRSVRANLPTPYSLPAIPSTSSRPPNLSHLGPGTPHRTALPCRSIGIYPPLASDLSMLPCSLPPPTLPHFRSRRLPTPLPPPLPF